MTKPFNLVISKQEFEKEVANLIAKAVAIEVRTITEEAELDPYRIDVRNWIDEVSTFLHVSFTKYDNFIAFEFDEVKINSFFLQLKKREVSHVADMIKKALRTKSEALTHILKVLDVCDAIMRPEEIDLEKRAKFRVEEKLTLIMEKLYHLQGEYLYPVWQILTGNGIPMASLNDARDLTILLEQNGYAEMGHSEIGEICARLTMKGIMEIERTQTKKPQKNKKMSETRVFISHGQSHLWKDVDRFISQKLEYETVILSEQINRGRTIFEKLEEEVEECDFAVVVMTADDEQKDGEKRARENVVHEIGFLQGALGRENVLVLMQKGIKPFSNILGIVYESFEGDNIKSSFERIRQEMEDFENS
jgi:predicted nucleotide-binding protein